jgi:hypothetical protein
MEICSHNKQFSAFLVVGIVEIGRQEEQEVSEKTIFYVARYYKFAIFMTEHTCKYAKII